MAGSFANALANGTIKNSTSVGGSPIVTGNPSQVVSTDPKTGIQYNYAGDPIGRATVASAAPAPARSAGTATAVTGGSGGTGGSNIAALAAAQAAAAQAAQARAQYDSGINGVRSGASDAFGSLNSSLQGSAQNLFNSFRVGQQGVDTSRANNELSRQNGIADIVGYVRNGLRQGAARLANGNALESSATGALASAYGEIGNSKSRSVNNQAAIASSDIDQKQNEVNLARDNGINDFHRVRDQQVAAISSDVGNKLTALDQQAIGLSIPDRIAVDQEKQRVINQGLQSLQGVDGWLQGQLATVAPASSEQTVAKANELRTLGTGQANPFNTGIAQGENSQQLAGPSIDQLPIFVAKKNKTA